MIYYINLYFRVYVFKIYFKNNKNLYIKFIKKLYSFKITLKNLLSIILRSTQVVNIPKQSLINITVIKKIFFKNIYILNKKKMKLNDFKHWAWHPGRFQGDCKFWNLLNVVVVVHQCGPLISIP